ncbi:ACT domain [Macleaya cordata]|uniref:ACT domain-containing protein ACR n=1 Tax=Macleaya cordata TaxID=56857 RepID=A0A200Q2D1_MACCD|nr:ACT domain [Macleaya cordata]
MKVCWPYFDPEFENFTERIYGPSPMGRKSLYGYVLELSSGLAFSSLEGCRVCIDNESCKECTVVKVDTVNKQGLLLRVVQALTDMNLTISKSYISSDAEWFMDVFHVKDEQGNKLTDQRVVNYIQQAIGARKAPQDFNEVNTSTGEVVRADASTGHIAIELTGTDRPGLFSEISAALADLRCNVVEAHAWSHNEYLACVAYISDQSTSNCITDPDRLAIIKDHLSTVIHATTSIDDIEAYNEQRVETVDLPGGGRDGIMTTNVEHRLHQLMLAGRDFEEPLGLTSISSSSSSPSINGEEDGRKTIVSIESCNEKGYSIVSIECKDRRRLMFDTVCTLTDMQYVVFHASIRSHADSAIQEYYIRHIDGHTLITDTEKKWVVKCLEAAIERRVCEGVRLELCAHNRVGLLSDITRMLRENGLAVVRADVATQGEKAMNAFYVRDVSGNEVDMEIVESMKREIEPLALEVKKDSPPRSIISPERPRLSFSDLLKSHIGRFSHNFVQIK